MPFFPFTMLQEAELWRCTVYMRAPASSFTALTLCLLPGV